MHNWREKVLAVRCVYRDDSVAFITCPKDNEFGTAIGFPSEKHAHNAVLSHRPVVGLNTDLAVGQRHKIEPVPEQGVDDFGLGWEETG